MKYAECADRIKVKYLLPIFLVVAALMDGLVLLMQPRVRSGNGVLIVRLDAIGDFVLWINAARALKDYYSAQGRAVTLLATDTWADWAAGIGVADHVWSIDTRRFVKDFRYRRHWLARVRRARFEIAIEPAYSRAFLLGDSVVRASGAPQRIGSIGDFNNIRPWCKTWSDRWYTRLLPATRGRIMELKRTAEFMRGIGVVDFRATAPKLGQLPDKPSLQLPVRRYAVLFPAASWTGRMWPVEKFAKIGERLAERGLEIVIAGGPSDTSVAAHLTELLNYKVVNTVARTSLGGLAEILCAAAVVVTNETSAAHIGAAVGAPVICVLGGGHFGRFAPYEVEVEDQMNPLPVFVSNRMACFGCNWNCSYERSPSEAVKCIREVSVDQVWDAVNEALGSSESDSAW